MKELARSYGLHLLPESGQLLQDNLTSLLRVPQPPTLRYGAASAQSPREMQAMQAMHEKRHQMSTGRLIAGAPGVLGPDLSASPSLPMLSPGRPGARNWVTFLHGAH